MLTLSIEPPGNFLTYWFGDTEILCDLLKCRDKGEVDFVVQTDSGITPIQVTVEAPQARHEDALAEFYRKFPHANEALFITPDSFERIDQVV